MRQLPAAPVLRADARSDRGSAGVTRVMARFTAHIDGGARGNPGPAGWGAVIHTPTGAIAAELNGAIPHATNNVAEYEGLLAALRWCQSQGVSAVHVRSDSLLLVQQMRGVYKVKSDHLKPLYGQARLLSHQVGQVTFEHIPRELNTDADRLANLAMDEAAESACSKPI